MRSLFQSRVPEAPPTIEPVRTVFPTLAGASMAAVFAGKRVAGDFYDALRANSKRILFGLLDVAGRREDTREILTLTQDIFRNAGAALFAQPDINESEAMTELCHLLNRGILDAAGSVRSCPGFVGCYNEELGTLCYTNAGHTPGLLRDRSGIFELTSTGLPLGLFSHATTDAPTVGLEPGAALLLVSRGVIEAKCRINGGKKAEFGLERVKGLLHDDLSLNPQELCSAIVGTVVDSYCEPPGADDDDRTALAFVRKT